MRERFVLRIIHDVKSLRGLSHAATLQVVVFTPLAVWRGGGGEALDACGIIAKAEVAGSTAAERRVVVCPCAGYSQAE